MGPGVVLDAVAGVVDPLGQGRVLRHVPADLEEGRLRVVLREYGEDLRGVDRIRPVVKGQDDVLRRERHLRRGSCRWLGCWAWLRLAGRAGSRDHHRPDHHADRHHHAQAEHAVAGTCQCHLSPRAVVGLTSSPRPQSTRSGEKRGTTPLPRQQSPDTGRLLLAPQGIEHVTPGFERLQDLRERGDRLAAIAVAVMQQDHRSAPHVRHHPGGDHREQPFAPEAQSTWERNCCSRGDCAAVKICSGTPDSTTTP
jgi:hypothetical protein